MRGLVKEDTNPTFYFKSPWIVIQVGRAVQALAYPGLHLGMLRSL